jgi:N-glycosylase/DNA lyase
MKFESSWRILENNSDKQFTELSKSRCAPTKGVGSGVHKRLYVPEPVKNVHHLLIIRFRWAPTTLGIWHWACFTKFLRKLKKYIVMRYRCFWEFLANCSCTKSVYLLPYQKTYSTRKTRSSIERTIVSYNWTKQLHTLLVFHFNRCLTTEYSEATAHFNSNFNADNQIHVPQPKCTATFRMHGTVSLKSALWEPSCSMTKLTFVYRNLAKAPEA